MITVRFLVAGGSQLAGSQEIVRSEALCRKETNRSKYAWNSASSNATS